MFSEDNPTTTEERIAAGKKIIEQIKAQNLGEKRTAKDFMLQQDRDIQFSIKSILDKLQEKGIDIYTGDIIAIQEIFAQEQENFRRKKLEKFLNTKNIPLEKAETLMKQIEQKAEEGTDLNEEEQEVVDELNTVGAEANKISVFGSKMFEIRGKVINEITTKIKEYFKNDLIKASQDSQMPQLSTDGWRLYFKLKDLNYKEIVQYTNWDFQTEKFPQAALEMVEKCAESLIKSGAIRNKFYDAEVREHITDEAAKKYMRTKYRPEASYTSYRKEHGIGDLKSSATSLPGRYTGTIEQHELMALFRELYRYVQKRNETFSRLYEDTFYAIDTRVRGKVQTALSKEHKVDEKHLYKQKLQKQVDGIRKEILDTYGTVAITPEQQEAFIQTKIEQEREKMEEKMALEMSVKYFAHMTDRSFEDVAKATGHLPRNLREEGTRGTILSEQVKNLIQAIAAQEKAGETPAASTKPTSPAVADEGR